MRTVTIVLLVAHFLALLLKTHDTVHVSLLQLNKYYRALQAHSAIGYAISTLREGNHCLTTAVVIQMLENQHIISQESEQWFP